MALDPFVGSWPPFSVSRICTQPLVLLGIQDQPVATPLPNAGQHKHRHPCLGWDANPRVQCFYWRRQYQALYLLVPSQIFVKSAHIFKILAVLY
jgi:hypothetical protein